MFKRSTFNKCKILTSADTKQMAQNIAGEKNFKRIEEQGECDFSVSLETGERFRVSIQAKRKLCNSNKNYNS